MSPADLRQLFTMFSPKKDDNLITGIETCDDGGVYRISPDIAQIHTADIITPVTSDPYLYGQIAAANSLSDVYAMGGRPVTALNLCFFPDKGISIETLGKILQGGLNKIEESGALLVGGHTVKDSELKYGLSVIGLVHPNLVVRNTGARSGDKLILTKPIGTGVYITAGKQGVLDSRKLELVFPIMAELNKMASETMIEFEASACTDITGFGLAGHGFEMAKGSSVGLQINVDAVPRFPDTLELVSKGIKTGLTTGNAKFIEEHLRFNRSITDLEKNLFYDPQTSGGLLIAIRAEKAEKLLTALHTRGVKHAQVIGECFDTDLPHINIIR